MIGNNYRSGTTLIEMVVAIGLFGTATLIGSGLVLTINKSLSKAEGIRATLDNLGFAFEMMTKEMRTGHDFLKYNSDGTLNLVNPYVDGTYSTITFKNSGGEIVTYDVSSGNLRKRCSRVATPFEVPEPDDCGGSNWGPLALTDPALVVNRLSFNVNGSNPGDTIQPRIIVIMGVQYVGNITEYLNMQTTVTQRKIDR